MRRFPLAACLLAISLPLAAGEKGEGWIDLFNGKDLAGWVNQGDNWRVIQEDGEPALECFKGGGSLTHERAFGDAILDLWFRLPPGQNSGIFFRGSKIVPGGYPPPGSSYEVQLYDHKSLWGHRTGDLLYPHRARRWASKPNLWNHCVIISLGRHHKGYLNGQCIFDVIDTGSTPEKGFISLQAHGGKVYFRRVRVKEITDGKWPEETGRLKALLFVGESRGIGKRIDIHGALIEKFLDDTGRFEITWSPEELALEPQYLSFHDLVILYDNRPDLSPKAQKQLGEFVRKGGGLVVLNRSTIGTFKGWKDFEQIVGAKQDAGQWTPPHEFEVKLPDGAPLYRVRDSYCRGAQLSLDRRLVAETAGEQADPVAWFTVSGKGKVYSIAFGQERATLENPGYQLSVINAATWVCTLDTPKEVVRLEREKDVAGLAKLFHRSVARQDWPLVEALGNIGTPEAVEELARRAMYPGDLVVRTVAVSKLGHLRDAGLDALHKILLESREEALRITAADALRARADAKSTVPLVKALDDTCDLVREKALAALGHMGTPQAEEAILARLAGEDPWWHEGALAALGRAHSDRARKALVAIARGRAAEYRDVLPAMAAALAAQMKHAEVFDAMVALLDAPAREARLAAGRALADSKDPRVHGLFVPRVFGADTEVGRIAEDYVRASGKTDLDRYMTPFIREWMVAGPFPNDRNRGFGIAFPPEKELKFDEEYGGAGGIVKWRRVKSDSDVVDLAKLFPKRKENAVAYAYVAIESPGARQLQLRTGSDDGIAGWLNSKRVLSVNRPRGVTPDEDRTLVQLAKGENRLLLKIVQGTGDWAFCARLADPKGNLAGLKLHLPEEKLEIK